MGSLNDKLNKTQQSKEDIKQAIQAAGGVIEDNTPLSGYDEAIAALEILDSAMKQDIDKLISSSSDYKTKLDTAVNNLSSYLNTLNSYINPSYTSGGNYLAPKLSNLNSQMYSLISNIRNRIVNNLGGSVSAYNLQAIYNSLGNISTGADIYVGTAYNAQNASYLNFSSTITGYKNYIIASTGEDYIGISTSGYVTLDSYIFINNSSVGGMCVDSANDSWVRITSSHGTPRRSGTQVNFSNLRGTGVNYYNYIRCVGRFYGIFWND